MARRLKTIAKEINEEISGYTAEIVEGYCNTDRKIPGTRLRKPGKGRYGNRIIVKNAEGKVVLDHNSAETYKDNKEVEDWLAYLKKHGKPPSIIFGKSFGENK
jgi:hypothetical protein